MKLTARSIKGLAVQPGQRSKVFFDSELKGFGVRCTPPSAKSPEGSASWVVEYRPGASKRYDLKASLVTWSSCPASTDVDARHAWRRTSQVRSGAAKTRRPTGVNPRGAAALKDLSQRYQERSGKPKRRAPPHFTESYCRRLWILPEFGVAKARAITKSDIARMHRKIGAAHPLPPDQLTFGFSSHFSNWAVSWQRHSRQSESRARHRAHRGNPV